MNPSSSDIESLQRRVLQLEAREFALRAALRHRMSRRIVTPATLAVALSAGATLGLLGACGKLTTTRHANGGISWLHGITRAVEVGGALMSLATLLGAWRRDTSSARPSDMAH